MRNGILVYILLIFFIAGCGSEDKKKVVPDGEIEHYGAIITPSQGQSVVSGESFKIELSLAQNPDGFEKVEFKMDNELIFESKEMKNNFVFEMNTSGLSMGLHSISTEIFFDGKSEINTSAILITSDIVPARFSYLVRNKLPHDINAYTQGLEFVNGELYEGTGLNGKSELRQVNLRTGSVIRTKKLDSQYFGEGITISDDKIYQITYQSNKGFVYDLKTFDVIKEFTFTTEGWGLTHDDQHLIMSDGTNKIYFLDKETFERKKEMEVYDNIGPVYMINELEYINGEIWANIYLSQDIIRIDPKTGKVTGKINCSGIFDPSTVSHKTDVLNGIAYDEITKKIYLTGKLWPNIFEVEFLNEQ
jgi:glutamine cyclotransferase